MKYYEEQKMDQWFFRAVLVLNPVLVLVCCFTPLIMEQKDGLAAQYPWSWVILMITLVPSIILWNLKLMTRIDAEGINLSYWPFPKKEFLWKDITRAYVREYRPFVEYDGWGARWRSGSTAYNAKGNVGLQLEFAGKKSS